MRSTIEDAVGFVRFFVANYCNIPKDIDVSVSVMESWGKAIRCSFRIVLGARRSALCRIFNIDVTVSERELLGAKSENAVSAYLHYRVADALAKIDFERQTVCEAV